MIRPDIEEFQKRGVINAISTELRLSVDYALHLEKLIREYRDAWIQAGEGEPEWVDDENAAREALFATIKGPIDGY